MSFWAQWSKGEVMSFLGSEAKSFLRYGARSFLRIQGVRLKLASIAKIENVNPRLQVKYLSN